MENQADDAPRLARQAGEPHDVVIVQSTVPDELCGKRIAHILVEESLVACAELGPEIVSMYIWQGELEGTDELALSLKTTAQRLPQLYARFRELHPYEVPEFLVLGVAAGGVDYLHWVQQATQA